MPTFNYTGANQSYVVPAGENYIKVTLEGAAGYPGAIAPEEPAQCGPGAQVVSAHKVTPGETITVVVGMQPASKPSTVFGGGGAGPGQPGGGATDIRRGTAVANRLSVAGGGGGVGYTDAGNLRGGAAGLANATGGTNGAPLYPSGSPLYSEGGRSGTTTAGGAGGRTGTAAGSSKVAGLAGSLGQGANSVSSMEYAGGGGGGGGYYGGGSGSTYYNGPGSSEVAGGGGGSSRVISGILLSTSQLSIINSPKAIIETYVPATPTFAVSQAATSRRALLTVDVKEAHPSSTGTKTITYEVSTSADFSTDLITKTVNYVYQGTDGAIAGDDPAAFAASTTAQPMALWVDLPKQGTWYARVRTGGNESLPTTAWAPTASFTSTHVPAASIVGPTGGTFVQYAATTPFRITASDPYTRDKITAYQIIVERNDTGEVVLDTNKQPIAVPFTVGTDTQTLNAAVPGTARDILLRWRVRVWDSTDVASPYTDYSLFTLVDAPVVAITAPQDGGTTDTGAPAITWTVGLTAGRTPASTTVTVREADTAALVWQRTLSGAVYSVVPETTILVNNVDYAVSVTVTDSAGLIGTDSNLFTTSYVSPDPIVYSVDASQLNIQGYVEINWSNQAPDERLIAWRVYRRDLPNNTWVLVKEIADEGTKMYRDYLVKSGKSYMWTVTQLADRSGAILESPVGTRAVQSGAPRAEDQIEYMSIDRYWLIYEDQPEMTVMLTGVTSAPENLSQEEETFLIVGRGRHRDYGDELGYEGTLTVQIRQPERTSALRERVEALWRARDNYWLRTPFGKLLKVALGNLDWDPEAGTGPMEMGDLTIPWVEVA